MSCVMFITHRRLTCKRLFKVSFLACTVATAAVASEPINLGTITEKDLSTGEAPTIKIDTPSVADSIRIKNVNTLLSGSNFTVNVTDSFTVNGDTHISIWSNKFNEDGNRATHAFYLDGDNGAFQAHLKGNVEITNTHVDGLGSVFGANALYLQRDASLQLGTKGVDTLTRIISIASIPDAISVKKGSSLTFNSTHNQVVGTIDLSSESTDAKYIKGTSVNSMLEKEYSSRELFSVN